MTPKEAIETIRIAQAEVEWEYPMNYSAAFDMAIEALQREQRMFCNLQRNDGRSKVQT